MNTRVKEAEERKKNGYNCAQENGWPSLLKFMLAFI